MRRISYVATARRPTTARRVASRRAIVPRRILTAYRRSYFPRRSYYPRRTYGRRRVYRRKTTTRKTTKQKPLRFIVNSQKQVLPLPAAGTIVVCYQTITNNYVKFLSVTATNSQYVTNEKVWDFLVFNSTIRRPLLAMSRSGLTSCVVVFPPLPQAANTAGMTSRSLDINLAEYRQAVLNFKALMAGNQMNANMIGLTTNENLLRASGETPMRQPNFNVPQTVQ